MVDRGTVLRRRYDVAFCRQSPDRTWASISATALVSTLAGCGWVPAEWPSAAPESASLRTETSAEGLAELFERECLTQPNRDWAAHQALVRRESCKAFLSNYGRNEDDCIVNVMPISWQVRTDPTAYVTVTMYWDAGDHVERPDPPPGLLQCTVSSDRDPGPGIEGAVSKVRLGGRSLTRSMLSEETITWRVSGEPESGPVIRFPLYGQDADYPRWKLEFAPRCRPELEECRRGESQPR